MIQNYIHLKIEKSTTKLKLPESHSQMHTKHTQPQEGVLKINAWHVIKRWIKVGL